MRQIYIWTKLLWSYDEYCSAALCTEQAGAELGHNQILNGHLGRGSNQVKWNMVSEFWSMVLSWIHVQVCLKKIALVN